MICRARDGAVTVSTDGAAHKAEAAVVVDKDGGGFALVWMNANHLEALTWAVWAARLELLAREKDIPGGE